MASNVEAVKWIGSILGERHTSLLMGHREVYRYGPGVAVHFYFDQWMEFHQGYERNMPKHGYVIEAPGMPTQRIENYEAALVELDKVLRAHAVQLALWALGIKD